MKYSEPPPETLIIQDTSEMNMLFVHSEVDEIGLTPAQFRVYAHLCRRTGNKDNSWPSIKSMSEICLLNRKTIISSLKVLEKMGMIKVLRTFGASSKYILTSKSHWKPVPKTAPVLEMVPVPKTGLPSTRNGTGTSPKRSTLSISNEVNTIKVLQGDPGEIQFIPSTTRPLTPNPLISPTPLPSELDTEEFRSVWEDYLTYRKERKLPKLLPSSIKNQWKRMAQWGSVAAAAQIEESIANGYQGIFEPKSKAKSHERSRGGNF